MRTHFPDEPYFSNVDLDIPSIGTECQKDDHISLHEEMINERIAKAECKAERYNSKSRNIRSCSDRTTTIKIP